MARINKAALVEEILLQDVFESATKKQVTQFVDDFFQTIANHVIAGDDVAITGFGKFEKYTKQDGTFKPKFSAFTEFKSAVKG
ncbi:MAG: HU family DNA-binding protein [Sulfuricurvum sp.]